MTASSDRRAVRVWAVWAVACALWSTVWLAIKIGVSSTPPLTIAWVRLALALAVLLPLAATQHRLRLPSRGIALRLGVSGFLLLGVNYACVFWASQYLPSALVAVVQAATPLAGMLFAAAAGLESITRRKTLALVAGMGGVAIICAPQLSRPASPHTALAFLAVLLSVTCVAGAYVMLKATGHSLHPTTVITWQSVAGGVALAAAALIREGSPLAVAWTHASMLATVYLALGGSVCAFWLNYWLLRRMPASALLLMGVAETPLAAMLGALVLDERLDVWTWIGTTVVLACTVAIVRLSPVEPSPARMLDP